MTMQSIEVANKEMLDAVRRMALMAEYRENNASTINHLERIRGYCQVLGRGLGLSVEEVEIVAYASQLHDIGLVSIPKSVLNKTGELSAYEWDLMKRHPAIGAEILQGSLSVMLQVGETIALSHHERWDGSGYPGGLSGESIPLSGRICALADVFDALTTPRAYKREVPAEEALTLVEDTRGVLFDPQIVDVFVERFDEILEIRKFNI
jgi:putative two-component system response regulator